MRQNKLGCLYQDGEEIFRTGDRGQSMFLVQKGFLEVVLDVDSRKSIGTLGSGESFGEISLFTSEPRSATIRSNGESRVLTIDKAAFMLRMKEDPMLAFRILHKLCDRMISLDKRGQAL